ncbi:MAG: T9SS type A sorting domain-containing protein, partial [Melioribacteraceae bacterium]|nr:T9SS type A sorting domain-containing protein [Melioribacteraceae bacterium]
DDASLLSGSYHYRLKQIDIDGTFEYSDLIEVNIAPPSQFTLDQNYPNPFNPTTKIRYSVPLSISEQNIDVKLIVYDVLGKEVVTIVDETQSAGNYEVSFNASEYPSGLYFYTINSGSFQQTRKMLLVK